MALIDTYKNNVQRKKQEILKFNENNAKEQKKIADYRNKIVSAKQYISRTKSESTIKSKSREIEGYEKSISDIEKKIAINYQKIAQKQKELNNEENKVVKEEEKNYKKQQEENKRVFTSTINKENLNSGKDQLYKTLQLVQNKLKNHVVRTSLEKYLTGTKLLNDFEKATENMFTSIDKLDEKSIQNFNDHLNSFLQDTKDKTNISLYHVRIIDSMNFTIDNAPTYIRENVENDDFTSSETIEEENDKKKDNQDTSKDTNNFLQDAGNPAELLATNLTTVGSVGNTIGCYRIETGWTYHSAPYQLTADIYSILIEFDIEPSEDEKLIADSNLYSYEMLKFGKSGHGLSMKASNILHIWGTNTTAGAIWMDSVDDSGASDLQIWNYTTTIHTNADFNSRGHQQTVYVKDTNGRVTDIIFNVKTASSSDIQINTYASFQKDNPHVDDTDSLEIDEDINAFAKLIAYKDLQTPLSVGLFGKWGSGKSFFMKKLDQKIKMFTTNSDDQTFCNNVVSIEFNAWHYSDTNLWASLVSHIFTKLHDFLEDKNRTDKTIFEELESSKKLILQKENEIEKIKKEQEHIETELQRISNEKQDNMGKFTKLKVVSIIDRILNRDDVKQETKKIKDIVDLNDITNFNELQNTYKELTTFYGVVKNFSYLLKNEKGFIVVGLLVTIGASLFLYLIPFVVDSLKDFKNNYFLPMAGAISGWWFFIKPYINKLTSYTVPLKTLINDWKIYKKQELEKKSEEEMQFERYKEELNLQELELKKDLYNESSKLSKIEDDIEDIKSGKFLASFIEGRAVSNDYKDHLGLISSVRDDFEKLTTEIKNHKLSADDGKEIIIDRIILYIDDLDRCQPEKVVEVLEAVHLLLAFDLFVVVVGVDPRWLTGSLNLTHQNFKDTKLNITPKQYLEKIFQIPFKVKSMNESNKKALVQQLLAQDIESKIDDNKDNEHYPSIVPENDGSIPQTTKLTMLSDEQNGNETVKEYQSQETSHIQLKLTAEEVNYIIQLADNIGNTPRTIKSFINIYRIIRSHHIINKIISNFSQEYPIIILLLCEVFEEEIEKSSFIDTLSSEQKSFYEKYKKENIDSYSQLQEFIGRFQFNVD